MEGGKVVIRVRSVSTAILAYPYGYEDCYISKLSYNSCCLMFMGVLLYQIRVQLLSFM